MMRSVLWAALDLGTRRTAAVSPAGSIRSLEPPTGWRGGRRLDWLCNEIIGAVMSADRIVIEGASYGSAKDSAHNTELTMLRGAVYRALYAELGIGDAEVIEIAPATLKAYAWHGRASKQDILDRALKTVTNKAALGEGVRVPQNFDEADAWWLWLMGRHAWTGRMPADTTDERTIARRRAVINRPQWALVPA